MMQYSDVDGNWKVKKNYRGEILVCVDISRRTTLKRIYCIVCGTFAACWYKASRMFLQKDMQLYWLYLLHKKSFQEFDVLKLLFTSIGVEPGYI
jgi:hypothetical protein